MKYPGLKALTAAVPTVLLVAGLSACNTTDADVASKNVSKAADQFEVQRRIVFYNGITGEVMLEIDGKCALGNADAPGQLSVICKTDDGKFTKSFLGLSDNVTFFVQQLQAVEASTSHYRVIWKPSTLIPNLDIK